MSVWLADEAATLRAGAALANALQTCWQHGPAGSAQELASSSSTLVEGGNHIHLLGGLGAGKTTLVRGLLRAMGVVGAVKSPTYTLVEPYQTAHWEVFHFDLYRLGDPEELELLGARDYFRSDALCVFEWPSKGDGALPEPSWIVSLQSEKDGRRLQIEACDTRGQVAKNAFKTHFKT
jgi:tRNA threonylcarbamoyladenosine biosynthesis protein TsaE